MKYKKDYFPYPGFYDLRDYKLPLNDFRKLWKIQDFLHSWEEARKRGRSVPPQIRELSGRYQQCLFAYELKEGTA